MKNCSMAFFLFTGFVLFILSTTIAVVAQEQSQCELTRWSVGSIQVGVTKNTEDEARAAVAKSWAKFPWAKQCALWGNINSRSCPQDCPEPKTCHPTIRVPSPQPHCWEENDNDHLLGKFHCVIPIPQNICGCRCDKPNSGTQVIFDDEPHGDPVAE